MSDLVWVPYSSSHMQGRLPVPSYGNKRAFFLYEHKKNIRWRPLPANWRGVLTDWLAEVALTSADFMEYTLLFVEE